MGLLRKDTVLPQSAGGNFIRLPADGNSIRVKLLGAQTEGWEYWLEDKTCIRSAEKLETVPVNMRKNDSGKPESPKFFWMFRAYEVTTKEIGVLQISQKQIMEAILEADGGDDFDLEKDYAVKIQRIGTTMKNTKYPTSFVLIKPELQPTPEQLAEAESLNLAEIAFGGSKEKAETVNNLPEDADAVLAAIM